MQYDMIPVSDRVEILESLGESTAPNPRHLARLTFAELPETTRAALAKRGHGAAAKAPAQRAKAAKARARVAKKARTTKRAKARRGA